MAVRRPAFSTEARTRLENDKVFDEIERFRDRLVALTVPRIVAQDVSPVAKTPMKVAVLVQSGLRRTLELTDSMVSDCNNARFVPLFVSSRAIFETALLLYDMADFVEDATKSRDFAKVSDLDERLMKAIVGSKAEGFGDPTTYQAPNVLTIAQRLSRQSKSFLDFYLGLSEFAHPNYSGMMGAYVTIDAQQGLASFLDSPDSIRVGASKYALGGAAAGLGILISAAERLEMVLYDFTSLCEELIHRGGTWPSDLSYPLHPPRSDRDGFRLMLMKLCVAHERRCLTVGNHLLGCHRVQSVAASELQGSPMREGFSLRVRSATSPSDLPDQQNARGCT